MARGVPAEGDPRLLADGWERRFVADAQRAQEAADLYGSMGLEVRLEPVSPEDLQEGCEDCRLVQLLGFRAVYTRQPPAS